MKCHACNNGVLSQRKKQQVFTYKEKSITVEQPGLWCNSCEEGILNSVDIAKTQNIFDEFKSKVDSQIT